MEGKQRKTDSSLFFLLISGESMNWSQKLIFLMPSLWNSSSFGITSKKHL
jgi:hypothetical protein